MENPLQGLAESAKKAVGTVKGGIQESKSIGNELRATNENKSAAIDSLKPQPAAPTNESHEVKGTFKTDLVNPGRKYGDRPGEKAPEKLPYLKEAMHPLGQMHSGGTVPKTGPYIMKKNEHVLTPETHQHLKNALSLAQTALSHNEPEKTEPEMPKHLREMHIKELHTGGFHVQKHDGKGGMTEHGAPHNDAVVGHFMDHMAHPDEDEEAVEAGEHDMSGSEAQEHALGYK